MDARLLETPEHGVMGIMVATRTGAREIFVRTPPCRLWDRGGSLSPRCCVRVLAREFTTEAGKCDLLPLLRTLECRNLVCREFISSADQSTVVMVGQRL